MNSASRFKKVDYPQPDPTPVEQPSSQDFLAQLGMHVTERFTRISGLSVVTIPLGLPGYREAEPSRAGKIHPACTEFANTEYCQESWHSHLAELKRRPEVHWHRCDFGLLCAFVPVVWRDQCLAGLKVVSAGSMAEDAFERNVELLDVLVESFVARESDLLARLLAPVADGPSGAISAEHPKGRPDHPRIVSALAFIEEHLRDPELTVGGVARELDLNPTYLAHLFAQRVGERMSRHIADKRIELAKELLSTTDWQIKRIAFETGHANPDWFSHVFHVRVGMTPGNYRRKLRPV